MALAIYPIGVERGFITRQEAVTRTLTTLRGELDLEVAGYEQPGVPRPFRL